MPKPKLFRTMPSARLYMRKGLLMRFSLVLQVWAEVKLGEQRARILSAIAQASEMRVNILHEDLCKV